jgi:hypothetical protein
MGKGNCRPKFGGLSLAQQVGRMASKHPQLKLYLHRNAATWTGPWLPGPLSDTYQLRITYIFPNRPKIAIISPHLNLAKGKIRLPHVYADGQLDICVHRPEEWNKHLYIVDTVMPWISEWLQFYECWEQTGSWEGKGTHPERSSHRAQDQSDTECSEY